MILEDTGMGRVAVSAVTGWTWYEYDGVGPAAGGSISAAIGGRGKGVVLRPSGGFGGQGWGGGAKERRSSWVIRGAEGGLIWRYSFGPEC